MLTPITDVLVSTDVTITSSIAKNMQQIDRLIFKHLYSVFIPL